jgi:hypothetical protein
VRRKGLEERVEEWRREALRIARRLRARPTAPPEEWDEYA